MKNSNNIVALLRVKNEARWIERVIASVRPVCNHVVVFDDHSEDDTAKLASAAGAAVYPSMFADYVDEARDRDHLLSLAFTVADIGDWALMIDGDEELIADDVPIVRAAVERADYTAYSLRILYLWDSQDIIRVDGVYGRFKRASLFRLTDNKLRFRRTTNGGNSHGGSVPRELLARPIGDLDARLLHYGYFDAPLRARKYEFYNRIDPNNRFEDCYRHVMQGDPGGAPADAVLMHAGPLRLTRI